MLEYSKFTGNIGSGNLPTYFVKIPTNFKKVWGVLHALHTPLDTPLIISKMQNIIFVQDHFMYYDFHMMANHNETATRKS